MKEQIKRNNTIQIAKRRQEIEVIPEFAKLFKDSETISSKKL